MVPSHHGWQDGSIYLDRSVRETRHDGDNKEDHDRMMSRMGLNRCFVFGWLLCLSFVMMEHRLLALQGGCERYPADRILLLLLLLLLLLPLLLLLLLL